MTVEIPTKEKWTASKPAVGGPQRRGHPQCPKDQCGEILGITISSPHGIVVAAVVPDGPADAAGIKPGDSIVACNGTRVSCPAVLLPLLGTGKEPLTVKLTTHRRKASGSEAAAAKGSRSAEQPE